MQWIGKQYLATEEWEKILTVLLERKRSKVQSNNQNGQDNSGQLDNMEYV